MGSAHWLGLDLGTSAAKAILVAADGTVVARHAVPYESAYGPYGEAEQDPNAYLVAARELIAACRGDRAIAGIGLSGQTPTLVLVDAAGQPVRAALTWQDHRATAEAEELAQTLADAETHFGTSLPWTAAYFPAKLLWLSRHEPATVSHTRWLLQPKDFLGLHLTGSPLSDPWSSKGLCHVATALPAQAALAHVGWPADVVPPLAQGWHSRGEVTDAAAAAFGLPVGAPVSVGWSDALAAMLAAGAFDAPTSFVLAGTSSIVGTSIDEVPPGLSGLMTIPFTCAPLAVFYGPTESSGASLQWLARLMGRGIEEVLALASAARGDVPIFTPYIAGERAPRWRTDLRGSFAGLSVEDGPEALAQSVVMGVCLSEADVLDTAEEQTGERATEIHIAGRGTASAPWREARLAALGRPARILDEADASALGGAMLGAAAASDGDLLAARSLRRRADVAGVGTRAAHEAAARLAAYRAISSRAATVGDRIPVPQPVAPARRDPPCGRPDDPETEVPRHG